MSLAILSFLFGRPEETFNEAYYATAAQVIPVLLAAAVVTRIWSEHKGVPVERNLISIAVVMFGLAGEYVAFAALSARETPDYYEDIAIAASMMLSGGLVVLHLLSEPVKAITSRIPEHRHNAAWRASEVGYISLVIVISVFRPDVTVVVTAAAFAVVICMTLLGFWRDNEGWLSRRSRRK